MPYEPVVPDGVHLGKSRKVEGAVVGGLYADDTGVLRDQAAWVWVDEPEPVNVYFTEDPPRQLTAEEIKNLIEVAGLIVRGVRTVSPHIRRWWIDSASPAMKAVWGRVISSGRSIQRAKDFTHPPLATAGAETGAQIKLDEPQPTMSRGEWLLRLEAMMRAQEFREEQLRILSDVRILDDAPDEVVPVTPRQFAEQILSILETRAASLDEQQASELIRIVSARFERNALELGSGPSGTRDQSPVEPES